MAVEFAIDPAHFHDAFAADLPEAQTAIMAATRRPVAELRTCRLIHQPAPIIERVVEIELLEPDVELFCFTFG
jgi:hypothetical protein